MVHKKYAKNGKNVVDLMPEGSTTIDEIVKVGSMSDRNPPTITSKKWLSQQVKNSLFRGKSPIKEIKRKKPK